MLADRLLLIAEIRKHADEPEPIISPLKPPPFFPPLCGRHGRDGFDFHVGKGGNGRPRNDQPPARAAGAFSRQGEERHLPVHGRRAEPARTVRPQAEAAANSTARPCPSRSRKGKRFAFIQGRRQAARLASGSSRKHGAVGAELSELLPHIATIADDICLLKGMKTDVFNHGPAKVLHQHRLAAVRPAEHGRVGHLRHRQRVARTCRGSSCCNPARAGRAAAPPLWRSGFLPTLYQGVPFLRGPQPILDSAKPAGRRRQRQQASSSTRCAT